MRELTAEEIEQAMIAALEAGDMPAAALALRRLAVVAPDTAQVILDALEVRGLSI